MTSWRLEGFEGGLLCGENVWKKLGISAPPPPALSLSFSGLKEPAPPPSPPLPSPVPSPLPSLLAPVPFSHHPPYPIHPPSPPPKKPAKHAPYSLNVFKNQSITHVYAISTHARCHSHVCTCFSVCSSACIHAEVDVAPVSWHHASRPRSETL